MNVPVLTRARVTPIDPPEPWEKPFSVREGEFFYACRYAGHPSVPLTSSDVPDGAFASLSEACGSISLSDLFVIPSSVRFIGWHGKRVITPEQVLAVSPGGVALWAKTETPGVVASIAAEDVSCIEDIEILLYGRLSFISAGSRLTIRYNTVARRFLESSLLRLRSCLAGAGCGEPKPGGNSPTLPYKWNVILNSTFLSLGDGPPRTWCHGSRQPRNRQLPPKSQMLFLTAQELIHVRDSVDMTDLYGLDRFFFPRSRIDSVRVGTSSLDLACRGASISVPMVPALLASARSWLVEPGL